MVRRAGREEVHAVAEDQSGSCCRGPRARPLIRKVLVGQPAVPHASLRVSHQRRSGDRTYSLLVARQWPW